MSYITDRRHLAKVTQQLLANVLDLQELWLEEDAGAHSPRASGDGPSGNGTADPTGGIANDQHKTRDRDAVGGLIVRTSIAIKSELDRRQPRTPTDPCTCCHEIMATHGTLCWDCDRFARKMKFRCDDHVHDGRPKIRMCECPTLIEDPDGRRIGGCCDVCPDRAAEGRTVSDRCRQRMHRDRQRES